MNPSSSSKFPDEQDVVEFNVGFYYTPNNNHIHLAISVILNNGDHIFMLPDGTLIDHSEFNFAPKTEINEVAFGKLFHELTYFPLHLREMPDALAHQIEKIIFEKYFKKSPQKVKDEKSSSSDGETIKSPDKKRMKKEYTPSPKSSPEPCVFSPCKKKSKVYKVAPKVIVTKKKSIKIAPQIGNIRFRDLSHVAEGFFGNRNPQDNIDSSDEDEMLFPIDMYRRLGQEVGESSRAMDRTIVDNDNSSFQVRDDEKKQTNRWHRIIQPETSSDEEESTGTHEINGASTAKNEQHRCKEKNANSNLEIRADR
ncbi:hypothetical protein PVAND_014335 [Polypedilum vanderplanki]|uniref:Uncharacterized protein n=1 Tax=Polypedilum vanderplanki TaxID=319348 RepID=A0A9J6CTJ5_POLVA|nr:hypothetical protein PVAND_014335 [Polypedilum vanderplanki]